MVCLKHAKKSPHFALYDRFVSSWTWQVVSWLITICAAAVFVTLHIRFFWRLLTPHKISTSTLMSSCAPLMFPACSPTLAWWNHQDLFKSPLWQFRQKTTLSKRHVRWVDKERYIFSWVQLQQHYVQAKSRYSYGITTWSGFSQYLCLILRRKKASSLLQICLRHVCHLWLRSWSRWISDHI